MASQIVALLLGLTVDSEDSVNNAHKLVNSVNNFIINVVKLSLCYDITIYMSLSSITDVYTDLFTTKEGGITSPTLSSLSPSSGEHLLLIQKHFLSQQTAPELHRTKHNIHQLSHALSSTRLRSITDGGNQLIVIDNRVANEQKKVRDVSRSGTN